MDTELMDTQESQYDRLMVVLAELRERSSRIRAEAGAERDRRSELRAVSAEMRLVSEPPTMPSIVPS
jgi:hypothetical protein